MLIYKFIGAALVVLGGWLIGDMLSRRERLKCEQIGGMVELIRYIRSQINIYILPLREIVLDCDRELARSCGVEGFETSDDGVIFQGENVIDEASRLGLMEYFERAGRGDRASELKLCDHYISFFDGRYQQLSRECPRRCRLIMTLCLCGAAGVALLLL